MTHTDKIAVGDLTDRLAVRLAESIRQRANVADRNGPALIPYRAELDTAALIQALALADIADSLRKITREGRHER